MSSRTSQYSPIIKKRKFAKPLSDDDTIWHDIIDFTSTTPGFPRTSTPQQIYVSPIVTILPTHEELSPDSPKITNKKNITVNTSPFLSRVNLWIKENSPNSPKRSQDVEISSVELSSMIVSPLQTERTNEQTPPVTYTTTESEIPCASYISDTTSLWDVVADLKYYYTPPTPSDSTGSEDYSIVFERRYQKEIQRKEQKKREEAQQKLQAKLSRQQNFQYFTVNNITWSEFNCDYIRFSLNPKDFFPNHFSSKRKYTFSMIYKGPYWTIKTFRIPERDEILKMRSKVRVTDKNIKTFLEYVVAIIMRNMELETKFKDERKAAFLAGEDLDINDSDLELYFNEEERADYLEKRERICRRMMSPEFF